MGSRQERLTGNQQRFRRANDRLNERVRTMVRERQRIPFLCECADETCTEPVSLTAEEYAAVRASDTRFLIVPGHQTTEDEDVVEEHDRYAVVEK
ncbi:MAG TPA: hypothetical protein VE693_10335 [Gaiellaceae bacterium]|jgi:hypothetical protein|nr:hypothetical protein [Gaiellaceae bacterium]